MIDVVLCGAGLESAVEFIDISVLEDAGLCVRKVPGSLVEHQRDPIARGIGAGRVLAFNVAPHSIDVDPAQMAAVAHLASSRTRPLLVGLIDRRFAAARVRPRLVRAALDAGADCVLPTWIGIGEIAHEIAHRVHRSQKAAEGVACDSVPTPRPRVDEMRRELVGPFGRAALTTKEALLMQMLIDAPGIVSREALGRMLWMGENWRGTPKAIDMHVANLRRKLPGACGDGWRITTIRGSGFILESSQAVPDAS